MNPLPILAALLAGLALGALGKEAGWSDGLMGGAGLIGGLWLNGLKMTIVPLVVSLLITGIAKMAEAGRAGRLAGTSVLCFLIVLWSSSILAALMTPWLADLIPLPASAAAALRDTLAGAKPVGAVPDMFDFFRAIVPANPIAAAANDAILPLIIFSATFAFAMLRLPEAQRQSLTNLFEAISATMLTIVGWVLWLAPLGVFALAFLVAAQSGLAALGLLAHYVLIVSLVGTVIWLAAWPVAWIGGRVGPVRFTRAILPSQAVAISTQSSLASLPAMLKAVELLGVPMLKADIVLPLAVALFRATGPAMNLAVALYVAHVLGIHPGPAQMMFGVAAAATTTLGAVSLPGQLSFISSIAPIALVLGVPIEPLGLLIAVETLPDIMRTMGNVSMDVAITTVIDRITPSADQAAR
jgi:Na+/H+-dicarboxylate symporter